MGDAIIADPLLGIDHETVAEKKKKQSKYLKIALFLLLILVATSGYSFNDKITAVLLSRQTIDDHSLSLGTVSDVVESENGVVAADDARCSEIGASVLRRGGHAVDAAVAITLCVDMYKNDASAKSLGALSMGGPGEIAGLYEAWKRYGRLPWKPLFEPAIELARGGFVVLKPGETCYNPELARSLETISEQGPGASYNGAVGEKLVNDVKKAGGIITMDDLRSYKVRVTNAIYSNLYTASGRELGLHRLIEAMKHMFAARMDLGDPGFVNITNAMNQMLSKTHAEEIRKKIFDNTTFPPDVSMTSTVNYGFGAGVLSPSTGIVLNNEMDDFSVPAEITPDRLPPAPTNFIEPNKRPLSSMTPLVITKDGEFVAALGGAGGMHIIPAVLQVFLNCFVLNMKPKQAVESARIYHRLIPNVVSYENFTAINGDHIGVSEDTKMFLAERGHELKAVSGGAIVQLIVQSFKEEKKKR
ncbi:Nucleophile aminohydrolases N-terminal [Arabidopsis thaliana x Arabidopsis arenosa]|uniref:Nucleophile aminohydrolases N-terminal n=1 Tax=Arabidopsis thaliana x Arabidopsis arenosa TaxID=1240361 RepID=A0A8T1XBI4_9BRAS|nr:Nucleophile aminohydrolases N-terminal [Arabidopsis thaliana x Arabidopsis arenosa]